VLCVDNYFTGGKDNIATCCTIRFSRRLRHDVTHPLFVEVDEIYNLACPARHPLPVHPVQTTKTSVIGAINMLASPRGEGQDPANLDLEVYGDPTVHPQPESLPRQWSTRSARAPAMTEGSAAPDAVFRLYRQHNLRIRVVRIFNTYGPRMHPNDAEWSQLHRAGAQERSRLRCMATVRKPARSAMSTI